MDDSQQGCIQRSDAEEEVTVECAGGGNTENPGISMFLRRQVEQSLGQLPGKEPSISVKTRSNSFHSTLEPNTEVFSKVSRSLAQFTLVNSFSTLLNKGGSTCNCPSASQDFSKHQTNQSKCTATLLQPDASEARVGGQSGRA